MSDLHWRPAPAVVVAGGEAPDPEWARAWLQAPGRLIAADSGWLVCQAAGRAPELVIGDLDSLTPEQRADLDGFGVPNRQFPADKDESDLQLALEHLARSYQGPVDLVAALGGRLDHLLFNVCSILDLALELGLEPRLVDPTTLATPLRPGQLRVHDLAGCTASLLPLSAELSGLTLGGFRYPLNRGRLLRRATRGLSNIIEAPLATIDMEGGEGLLVLLSRQDNPAPSQQ